MRQGQHNKNRSRGRGGGGRGGRQSNPLNRVFESNGPDVKVRGNAQTVADKYQQLARDALSSGDNVIAENYFQHAEHYQRIVAAAQAFNQQNQQQRKSDSQDGGDGSSGHKATDDTARDGGKTNGSAKDDGDGIETSQQDDKQTNARRQRGKKSARSRDNAAEEGSQQSDDDQWQAPDFLRREVSEKDSETAGDDKDAKKSRRSPGKAKAQDKEDAAGKDGGSEDTAEDATAA